MLMREPLTFEEFAACSRHRQLAHAREERERMREAARLWLEYKRAMARLGLHPLTLQEIQDREAELRGMERAIGTDDVERLRAGYELYLHRPDAA